MKNRLSDYHVHSAFSLDSRATLDAMANAAVKKNLSEICLTEHKDLDPFYKWKDCYNDDAYTEKFLLTREEYIGQILLKKGVELDYQELTVPEFLDFLSRYSFDFVLASVHALEHEFVGPKFFHGRDPDKAYHDYLLQVLSLSDQSGYDVLGHLDYIKRFAPKDNPFNPEKHEDLLGKILLNLVRGEKGLELNTAGWRHGHGEPYPSTYVLRMFRELGGEIVTIGSDAHREEDVGSGIERGAALLEELGFNGYYVFSSRIPEKILFEQTASLRQ